MKSENARLTIEEWTGRLRDPEQVVRIHAATVLGAMGDDAEPAVPVLIDMLRNGTTKDRRLAALTLGEIGPGAADAVPDLFAAAGTDDEELAELASWALEEIDLIEIPDEAA